MRKTQTPRNHELTFRTPRSRRAAAVACAACAALLAIATLTGCGTDAGGITSPGSSDTTPAVGARMGGPVVDVNVTPEALASKPKPAVLVTPEEAVRSYLDWTSYAYRIGQSPVAKPFMTPAEEVRVDSYIQLNFQKFRLIDQKLDSIALGTPSIEGTRAVITAKEKWTYSYVSIKTAGKVEGGPFTASYDTTYTVLQTKPGHWLVDSVEAKALGTVE